MGAATGSGHTTPIKDLDSVEQKYETAIGIDLAGEKAGFNSIVYDENRYQKRFPKKPELCPTCSKELDAGRYSHRECVEVRARVKLKRRYDVRFRQIKRNAR